MQVEYVDPDSLDTPKLVAMAYESGNLAYKLLPHQKQDFFDFLAWDEIRQTQAHLDWVAEIDALYDNLWVDECGRRFGKTAKWLLTDYMAAVKRQNARGLIATPMQSSIGGIIVPLTKILFADAPKGYFPRYVTTFEGDQAGLVIDATGSFIKLVGLDKHPDKTRGQFLDFCHVTEAAFVKGLYDLQTGVINPQFRGRPWAWCAMESSTAKVKDCDFNRQFREDAKLRGTYRKRTIRDNKQLTEKEIQREERLTGGARSANCRRELYCEEVRDAETLIVPEFNENVHVVDPADWVMPKYAHGHVGYDPGTTDPHGQVGLYFDWLRQCIVVLWSWAKSNSSTGEVVRVTQRFERQFFGTDHREPGEPTRELSIRDALANGAGKVWETPANALTYWDPGEYTLKPNPRSRISDIDNQFVIDLNTDHGMNLRKAEKGPGSKEADTEHLRTLFEARPVKIVILRNGETDQLIEQLRSGQWDVDENGHKTDWLRSKTLGHCDCIAALKYVVRDVRWNLNPNKPPIVDPREDGHHVPRKIREAASRQGTPAYGGRGQPYQPR